MLVNLGLSATDITSNLRSIVGVVAVLPCPFGLLITLTEIV